MSRPSKENCFSAVFLLIEAVLYGLILTTGGRLLVWSCYSSIVLCFLFVLFFPGGRDPLILAALGCTVMADLFLVVWTPTQQLWGMVFFLGAQTLYCIRLHRRHPSRGFLAARLILILAVELAAVLILKEKLDALAVISVCYYSILIVNALQAFSQFRIQRLFPVALILFILCDTVIGLQVAAGGYLPIAPDSWLHRLIFSGFPLAWFFYLPSQVLIALSGRKSC